MIFSRTQKRIQIKHKLTPADMKKHLVIWQWFESKIEEDLDFLDDVWFSEEAHFWLCGHINSNNCVYWRWGAEVPEEVVQRPLHCEIHGLGGHLKTLNNCAVLVWKCRWGGSHFLQRSVTLMCGTSLEATWNMSWCELRCVMVPIRWGNSTYSQHHDGVAQPLIP